MKALLKTSGLASLILLAGCWKDQPSKDAKDQAGQVGDAMRTMRDATNAQGEDRLKNDEIKDYERKVVPLLDKDNLKSMRCGVLVMEVQNLITEKNWPDQYRAMADSTAHPEVAKGMREQALELEKDYQDSLDEIVIGSLTDWLFRFAQKSMKTFGAEGNKQAYQAVHHECMQKPLENVMNSNEKM